MSVMKNKVTIELTDKEAKLLAACAAANDEKLEEYVKDALRSSLRCDAEALKELVVP